MWSEVSIGKWRNKSKTLPQILVADPDWFFWAIEENIFQTNHYLKKEAQTLNLRARSIIVPEKYAPKDTISYKLMPDGKFAGIELIPSTQPRHIGSSTEIRTKNLDLSKPRSIKKYDKLGSKLIMKSFKYYWFENKSFSRNKVESFFSNYENFEN